MVSTVEVWRNQLHRYNLEGTRCTSCRRLFFPPRLLCPECRRKGTIENYKFKGKGEVVIYTIVHQSSPNSNRRTPFVLAIIRLEEGPSLLSEVICEPEEIYIGMKVKAAFRKIGEEGEKGVIYYGTKFVPAEYFS